MAPVSTSLGPCWMNCPSAGPRQQAACPHHNGQSGSTAVNFWEEQRKQRRRLRSRFVPKRCTGLGKRRVRTSAAYSAAAAAIGKIGKHTSEMVDAGGLALMPGTIDLRTYCDAQVTWDPTLSSSPSRGHDRDNGQLRLRHCAVTIINLPQAADLERKHSYGSLRNPWRRSRRISSCMRRRRRHMA